MKLQRAQDLRAAVDRLPLSTRTAMLKGLEKNSIIVGAAGNVHGGRCPMLAASVGSSKVTGKPFARAWDNYAGVRFSRPATRHELNTLRTMLQASIDLETEKPVDLTAAISRLSAIRPAEVVQTPVVARTSAGSVAAGSPPPVDLQAAIAAHMASKDRSSAAARAKELLSRKSAQQERPATGERDRTEELEGRHGWAWLRPFRRFDDFERAVQQLEDAERAGIAAYSKAGESDAPARWADDGRKQPVGTPAGGY